MSTNQQIKDTLVNAVEGMNLGYARTTYGVDRAIDTAAESLSESLKASVEAFLDKVGERNASLVGEARDLFIEVGLLDAPEEVVDPAVAERDEAVEEVKSLLTKIKDALAKVGVEV